MDSKQSNEAEQRIFMHFKVLLGFLFIITGMIVVAERPIIETMDEIIEEYLPPVPEPIGEPATPKVSVVQNDVPMVTGYEQGGPKFLSIVQEEAQMRYLPTYAESVMACQLAAGEAGVNYKDGMQAVMETVIAQIKSDKFPNDVISVALNPGKFSCIKNGVPCIDDKPVRMEEIPGYVMDLWREVCKGTNLTEDLLKEVATAKGITDPKYWEGGSLYFANFSILEGEELASRADIRVKVKIDNGNTFYRYWDKNGE